MTRRAGEPRTRIRSARPEEAPVLTRIALAAKASWGYPDAWLRDWDDQLAITPEFVKANPVYVVVDAGDEPLGVAALEDTDLGLEIAHLRVHPDRQGEGLGRMLLDRIVRHARSMDRSELRILSDPNAVGFYERAGARSIGSEDAPVAGTARSLPVLVLPLDAS